MNAEPAELCGLKAEADTAWRGFWIQARDPEADPLEVDTALDRSRTASAKLTAALQ